LVQKMKRFAGGELGLTLIEAVVALAILGMAAVIFLGGLSIASKATIISQERVTAENLAKSQVEQLKNENYRPFGNYLEINISTELQNQGYAIDLVEVEQIADGLQKITIAVSRNGEEIFEIEAYKLER
jgi:type II secretory pathway pseudopilin PulG